jgi:chitodextrinase
MKKYVLFLLFLVPLLAVSCFRPPPQQASPEPETVTETPTLLGEVEVTFTLDTLQASSQLTAHSSTLTLTPVSSQLADENGLRYLYGTLQVTNAGATNWKNLTLYALNRPSSLGGTAVLEMADSDGEALVDPLFARAIVPTQHAALPNIAQDFQAFTANDVATLQTLGGFTEVGKNILHYGYVATANGSRTIPKNETGLVTIAVAYPYKPDEAQVYPSRFTLTFAVATQPKTTLSQSEGVPLCERASALAASEIIVLGQNTPAGDCTVTRLNDIKIAVASNTLPEAFLLTPATPRQLSSRTANNAVALSWEGNLEPDLAAYRLYRNGTLIYEGKATSFTDGGLSNDQNYSYSVSAVDLMGYASPLSAAMFATPQGGGTQPIWLEAETASGGSNFAPWQVYNDSSAGAGKYIEVRTGSASNDTPPANGEATYTFTLGEAGDYVVWARVIAPTTARDSFWVSIDSGPWIKWNNIDRSNTWLWDQVHNADNANQVVLFSLAAGPHTLKVKYRELNTKADKFHVTKDLSFIPSGQGGAHNDGTGTGDTTPPATPTGLAATPGNAQVALSWNANSESDLGGYRLYRDGVQVYQGPALSFNNTGLTNNQSYSYTIAAYDTSGNLSAQSAPPVSATPTAPPGPATPTGLSASAGVGQIQLSWNANTEGNLAGYRLYRNGTQIYQGTTPNYLNTGLTGGATYSYTVSAFDTNGNESALSAVVVATAKFAVLHHLIGNGQSVMGGSQSTPVLTTTQAFDTKMFSSIRKPGNLTTLNPLVEQAETFFSRPHGETIASGMTAQIRSASAQPLLFSVDFTNGFTISGLDKGSAAYNGTLAQVAAGENFAASYKVSAINWIQGGGDIEANTSYTSYKNLLQGLYSDYITDIVASSGQSENPMMLVGQISHWTAYNKTTSPIPIAQLQASRDTAGMYLVGPEYPYARVSDGIHYTNHSQRWYGSQFGKVYDRIVRQGVNWRPLEPTSVAFNSNDIVVNFHVPAPPLVWDTTLVSNPGNYGFEIFNATTGTNISINTPVIEGSSVRITPSSPLQNGHSYRLRIAYTGISGNAGGPTTGPRANLRDSDSAAAFYSNASGTPYPLYNWVVTVDELIGTFTGSGDTTPPAIPTGLAAIPGNAQVQLNWSANSESDLAGYRLYRNGTLIYNGSNTSYLNTGLSNGTTYTYTLSAYDTSGNESAQSSGVPATPTGTAPSAEAIRFDESASPSQYFTIADNTALTLPNGNWSVGFWAKVNSNQGSVTKYVLSTGAWGGTGSFNIMLGEPGNTSFSNKWVARMQGVQLASSSAPGGDGIWRLVIVQRRGTLFELYFAGIGGTPTLQASANVGTLGSLNGGNWIMGGRADFAADRFFSGDLAEMFMGNFSLTTNEITQLASGSTITGIGKSPVFYHSVVKSGTTLLDQSGNGFNATQSGNPMTAPHPFQ